MLYVIPFSDKPCGIGGPSIVVWEAKTGVKHPRCLYGRVILDGVSVFGRCHAGVALEVFTECELLGKIEFLRDFLDAFVGLLKRKLGVGGRDRRNPFRRRLTGRLPYDSGKMPGGHIGKGGIPIHGALRVVILMEGKYESVCDTTVVVDGINRGGIAADMVAHNLKHGLEADDMRQAGHGAPLIRRIRPLCRFQAFGHPAVLRHDERAFCVRYLPTRLFLGFERNTGIGYQVEHRIEKFKFAHHRDGLKIGRRNKVIDLHQGGHHKNNALGQSIPSLVNPYIGMTGGAKYKTTFVPIGMQRFS